MTSEISLISEFLHVYDQSLLEYLLPNVASSNRLLSPIIENSAETLPRNRTCSDTSQRSPDLVLTIKTPPIVEELDYTLLLHRFHQYTRYFQIIQSYLNTLNQHFRELSMIMNHLRTDKQFRITIEPLETRLLQMDVKRNQIEQLLNHSSTHNLIEQILPFIFKSKLSIDYNDVFNSLQLSMNHKSTLIDHLKNEYRYAKYHTNEFSTKVKQRQELLIKLTKQIEQFNAEQDRMMTKANHIVIAEEHDHDRQALEITQLSNEYEQLRTENHLLTLKAKENLQRFSKLMQSNDY